MTKFRPRTNTRIENQHTTLDVCEVRESVEGHQQLRHKYSHNRQNSRHHIVKKEEAGGSQRNSQRRKERVARSNSYYGDVGRKWTD